MPKSKNDQIAEEDYEDMNMITEYFERTAEYKRKYGPNTLLLMQCGTFYEVYAYSEPNEIDYRGGSILEFSKICNMAISTKKVNYKNYIVYMAGFTFYKIDHYVQRLVEQQYTVVEYIQEDSMQTNGKKKVRRLNAIYSPGTHLSFETNNKSQMSNHIMCIWVHEFRSKYIIGVSLLNNYTGQTYLMEHILQDQTLHSTSFDELDKYISIYQPREMILICNAHLHDMIRSHIHHNCQDTVPILCHDVNDPIVMNANDATYYKHILSKYFGTEAIRQCAEFSQYEIATQSFCVLMNFLEERNPKLCKHIQLPLWENTSTSMVLANHTLQQLNILEDSSQSDRINGNSHTESQNLLSVHSWTNKCMTIMGKRLFREILTQPIFDIDALNKHYNAMGEVYKEDRKTVIIESTRKQLRQIQDIHKLSRQMTANKMYPSGLQKLYSSLLLSEQMLIGFEKLSWLHSYLEVSCWSTLLKRLRTLLAFLQERFFMEHCGSINSITSFDKPILKKGYYPELDELYNDYEKREKQLKTIWMFFERQMSPTSKLGEYVKHVVTDKTNHHSLQMTVKRCETLAQKMKTQKGNEVILENDVNFKWSEVTFASCATKTQKEIHFPLCHKICSSLSQFQGQLNQLTQELFLNILREIENEHIDIIEECSRIVANIDVLLNKCYIAQKYNYCCPIIDNESQEKAFVKTTGLRHILIEHLNTNEIYVSNDLCIGSETDEISINGMLLFGANTSGKTSNMRALGIAVIMAQAGMYVPCKSFVYKPYHSLYSRILNQDNFFKGLSTFAVEMSELRVILKYADENSLVLGDELCSGTETVSALSIMMSSLIQLDKSRCSFMFTTHFHEIIHFQELQELPKIQCFYLEIRFNAETGKMEYDRILKKGSGPSSYGLEVCESLYMDPVFLEKAYEIRRTHFPEYEGSLRLSKSRYNAKKLKGKCEKCGNLSEEIHHIHPQKDADENGYIDKSFHKNNPANLMALCEGCHLKIHHHDSPVVSEISEQNTEPPKKKIVKRIVRRKVN
jgi:DNA mismatch repair protein MutS